MRKAKISCSTAAVAVGKCALPVRAEKLAWRPAAAMTIRRLQTAFSAAAPLTIQHVWGGIGYATSALTSVSVCWPCLSLRGVAAPPLLTRRRRASAARQSRGACGSFTRTFGDLVATCVSVITVHALAHLVVCSSNHAPFFSPNDPQSLMRLDLLTYDAR